MIATFDTLIAIAQIAATFAGFGAVATAFGSRDQAGAVRVDAGRMMNLIIMSLSCISIAVLPAVIGQFDIAERWVWGSAAAAYLLVASIAMPAVLLRTRQMGRHGLLSVPALVAGVALGVVGITAMLLTLFDFPTGIGAAAYTAGLFAMLCNTLVLFYVLVRSLLQPYAPDVQQPAPPTERSAD
ncbi:MAG: hypothetical protein EON93_05005 [Burkholderiales bacterium]|nr:MAG: hypothetical protein EON93_05005 [Burkholderiales bacterium]